MKIQKLSFLILAGLLIIGCAASKINNVEPESRPGIVDSLSQVNGVFSWNEDSKQFEFSEKDKLEEILTREDPHEALGVLVDCLDNSDLSFSEIKGVSVTIGRICYEALRQLAYYEPSDSQGDVAAPWEGDIPPLATPDQMESAKSAWKKAISEKIVIFY